MQDTTLIRKETHALLKTIQEMVDKVNETNSTLDKINILKNYPQLKPFLKLLMDQNQTMGLTSKKVLEYEEKLLEKPIKSKTKTKTKSQKDKDKDNNDSDENKNSEFVDLYGLINNLYSKTWTGNEAKEQTLKFMNTYPEHKPLICKIINKNLETRLDVKQINKAFHNLIIEFSVALANDFSKAQSFFQKNQNRPWFLSRKYDGVRCVVEVNITDGKVQAYSRNGNNLPALYPLVKLLTDYISTKSTLNNNPNNNPNSNTTTNNTNNINNINNINNTQTFYLDGEICVLDKDGNEDFSAAVSNVRKKNVLMNDYRYYVFDMLTEEEFVNQNSISTLSERITRTKTFIDNLNCQDRVRLVEQVIYSPQTFQDYQKKSLEENWEGLMLRLGSTYQGKRSNEILKVKNFQVEEYKVESIEVGPFRIIDSKTGLEKTIDTMSSIVINHKGNQVNVGSGFNFEERQRFLKSPEDIVGKIISVKYFEESKDKNGKLSLRFPTFYGFHGDERDV